ncbi:MAG: hypothetical protein ACI9Z7_000291, partial [Alteromonas macleodii]
CTTWIRKSGLIKGLRNTVKWVFLTRIEISQHWLMMLTLFHRHFN